MGTLAIFTTDDNLNILSWDPWLEKATGISQSEAKGKPLSHVIPNLEERNLTKRFQNVLKEGVVEVLSPVFHHYLIPIDPLTPSKFFPKMQQKVTIAPLREQEKIVGTIVTIEDLTEKLEREQMYSKKLKDRDETVRLSAAESIFEEEYLEQKDLISDILKDESWRVRKIAVEGLKRRTDREIVSALLVALKEQHQNINVLNSAIQVLTMSDINVTDAIIDFLKSEDKELRQYAALCLGEIKDKRAIPSLIEALNDEDKNVKFHVIEALGKLGAVQAVSHLLEIVNSKDFFLSFAAIDALTNIGDTSVANRLIPLLEDDMLAQPTVDALGALGDEEVIPCLVNLLNHGKVDTLAIVKAILQIYNRYTELYGEGSTVADIVTSAVTEKAVERIIGLLGNCPEDSVNQLIVMLGWLRGRDVDVALTKLLGDPSAKKEVVEAVVQHGKDIVELLIEQIYSDDIETCKAAIIALGRIGDKSAVPHLLAKLKDEPQVAMLAAGALAKIGDRSAFEALLGLLGDPDPSLRQAVISALNSIGHPDMPKRIAKYLKHKDPIVRESAVKIAGYFGYEECIELLLESCKDESENVRYAAIQSMPFVEDERAFHMIVSALKNDTPRVRAAAAYALGQIEGKDAVYYIEQALQDQDPWVRYFASKAAGEHRDPKLIRVLSELIQKDSAHQVRIAAIEAIGKIGLPQGISSLTGLLKEDNMDIVRITVGALGNIDHPESMSHVISALYYPQKVIKIEAIRALGKKGAREAVDALRKVFASEKDEMVLKEIVESLCLIGDKNAITTLMELSADKEKKNLCVAKLSQLRGRHLEWIAEGLSHEDPAVRCMVVDILARMKHPDATEAMLKALDDPDPKVRLATVRALGHLGSAYGERKLAYVAVHDPDETVRATAERLIRSGSAPIR